MLSLLRIERFGKLAENVFQAAAARDDQFLALGACSDQQPGKATQHLPEESVHGWLSSLVQGGTAGLLTHAIGVNGLSAAVGCFFRELALTVQPKRVRP
jgi:hypothetical protein